VAQKNENRISTHCCMASSALLVRSRVMFRAAFSTSTPPSPSSPIQNARARACSTVTTRTPSYGGLCYPAGYSSSFLIFVPSASSKTPGADQKQMLDDVVAVLVLGKQRHVFEKIFQDRVLEEGERRGTRRRSDEISQRASVRGRACTKHREHCVKCDASFGGEGRKGGVGGAVRVVSVFLNPTPFQEQTTWLAEQCSRRRWMTRQPYGCTASWYTSDCAGRKRGRASGCERGV